MHHYSGPLSGEVIAQRQPCSSRFRRPLLTRALYRVRIKSVQRYGIGTKTNILFQNQHLLPQLDVVGLIDEVHWVAQINQSTCPPLNAKQCGQFYKGLTEPWQHQISFQEQIIIFLSMYQKLHHSSKLSLHCNFDACGWLKIYISPPILHRIWVKIDDHYVVRWISLLRPPPPFPKSSLTRLARPLSTHLPPCLCCARPQVEEVGNGKCNLSAFAKNHLLSLQICKEPSTFDKVKYSGTRWNSRSYQLIANFCTNCFTCPMYAEWQRGLKRLFRNSREQRRGTRGRGEV